MALKGIRVIELAGLAPVPFCGMVLADFGASVIRIDRPYDHKDSDRMMRGKKSVVIDLKKAAGQTVLRKLCKVSDVLLDPYRPGVLKRLGLDYELLQKENPRLVVAAISGYGQTGSMVNVAGHDINYLALSGILSKLRWRGQKPTPPINLIADFAGGGLLCAFGIVNALFARERTGKGQIVDMSMTEGAAYVGSWLYTSQGFELAWPAPNEPGKNLLDGGFPLYGTYETKDGKFVAVGAIEPQFQTEFFRLAELDYSPMDSLTKPDEIREKLITLFKTKTRDEWTKVFEDSDACVAPVLEFGEVADHPLHKSRQSFQRCSNVHDVVPTPAPRLSSYGNTKLGDVASTEFGSDTTSVLTELGYSVVELEKMQRDRVIETRTDSSKSKL